jgi:hypothetical protein
MGFCVDTIFHREYVLQLSLKLILAYKIIVPRRSFLFIHMLKWWLTHTGWFASGIWTKRALVVYANEKTIETKGRGCIPYLNTGNEENGYL